MSVVDFLGIVATAYHAAQQQPSSSGFTLGEWAGILTAIGAAGLLPKIVDGIGSVWKTLREDRQRQRADKALQQQRSGELGFEETKLRVSSEEQLRAEVWSMNRSLQVRVDELNQKYGVVLAEKAALFATNEAMKTDLDQYAQELIALRKGQEERIAELKSSHEKDLESMASRMEATEAACEREVTMLREGHSSQVHLLEGQIKLLTDRYATQGMRFSEQEHDLKKRVQELQTRNTALEERALRLEEELAREVRGHATRRDDAGAQAGREGDPSPSRASEATAAATEAKTKPPESNAKAAEEPPDGGSPRGS